MLLLKAKILPLMLLMIIFIKTFVLKDENIIEGVDIVEGDNIVENVIEDDVVA